MAIEFKNNLDINQNQLLDAVIELQDTDVNAGTGTQGQLYSVSYTHLTLPTISSV